MSSIHLTYMWGGAHKTLPVVQGYVSLHTIKMELVTPSQGVWVMRGYAKMGPIKWAPELVDNQPKMDELLALGKLDGAVGAKANHAKWVHVSLLPRP